MKKHIEKLNNKKDGFKVVNNMSYSVYVHTFPNNKRYVGATCQTLKRRWRDGKGYEGQPVYSAILKYGWGNIKHEILFMDLNKEEAEKKEIELIAFYKSNDPLHGYNIEAGGSKPKLSEETKMKISKAKQGKYAGSNHWNYGNHWSEEVKEKISKAHKGMKMSEEQRQKLSERFSGANNPMYGTKMPPKHKVKLQADCVKACSKPVICIETGMVYKSGAEAHRKTGIHSGTIYNCCKKIGFYKTAGGYHWEYFK